MIMGFGEESSISGTEGTSESGTLDPLVQEALGETKFRTEESAPDTSEQPTDAPSIPAFYDATKVPAELQPSFKEMQAAWTKKTQDHAKLVSLVEQMGGLDSVAPFLEQFSTDEGALGWFLEQAKALGPEELAKLAGWETGQSASQQTPATPEGEPAVPSNSEVLTRQDLDKLLADKLAEQRAELEAEKEVESVKALFTKQGVKPEHVPYVAEFAERHPMSLGYEKRIEKGKADFQKWILEQASEFDGAQRQVNETAPSPLTGTTPVMEEDDNDDWRTAEKKVAAYLAAVDRQKNR